MDENNQMLQQALEQFNRKERYWLLREALGGLARKSYRQIFWAN